MINRFSFAVKSLAFAAETTDGGGYTELGSKDVNKHE